MWTDWCKELIHVISTQNTTVDYPLVLDVWISVSSFPKACEEKHTSNSESANTE